MKFEQNNHIGRQHALAVILVTKNSRGIILKIGTIFVAENRKVAKYEKVKVILQYNKSESFELHCSLAANIWLEN